jgi:hypothetical protein
LFYIDFALRETQSPVANRFGVRQSSLRQKPARTNSHTIAKSAQILFAMIWKEPKFGFANQGEQIDEKLKPIGRSHAGIVNCCSGSLHQGHQRA